MIERHILPYLLETLNYFPIIAIIGPRQVGKTTLAKSLGVHLPKQILYLDLENTADALKMSDAQGYLSQNTNKCVIIDEVQMRPDLFPLLRSLTDEKREAARFILLGSASPHLLKENTETLAGRIAYHELTPFCYTEIQTKFTVREHWLFGGFPNALLAPSARMSRKWLIDFLDTFVTRDVKRLRTVVPETKIHNLIRMVAHLQGSLLNISNLSNSLDVSQSTVSSYLELLEGSFMIRRLPPYFQNIGKRLTKSPKIYVRDSGLLHRLLGISTMDQLSGHPQIGTSWEGYVIEQIIRLAEDGSQFYFYRTSHGAEVDLFWITDSGKKVCCEIKYSVAPVISRGFYECIEDLKPDFKYVIIPEGESYFRNDNVKVTSLANFLNLEMPEIQQ